MYPNCCISASSGRSPIQIEKRESVWTLGLLDHLIKRI